MEEALNRKKLHARTIYGNSYMQKGATHKAKFCIKRSHEQKRVTHGKEYVWKGITHNVWWSQGLVFEIRSQFSSGCKSSIISSERGSQQP